MKKDKLMYNPPVVEPLVIRFEGNLLYVSNGVSYSDSHTAGVAGGEDSYDDIEDEF